jgi:lipopolysaccharide export system permease protein
MLVLMPLVSFLLLSAELDNVGKGQYTLLNAFVIIGLTLPRYAYQILPIGALIGSLWGLGNLATHSELTAMRSAGISMAQVVYAVLKAGLVVALIAVILGEAIAPVSDEKGNQLRAEALSESIALKSRYGFWARDGKAFINIREILPGGRLRSIFIYEFDDEKRLKLSTYAKSAIYTGDSWRLEDIRQSELVDTGVKTRASGQAVWDSLLDPAMLSLLIVDPHILPAWDLYRYIGFMEDNRLNATTYQVAFWTKMAMPMIVLAMMALTVPMLFGALRTVSIGQRIFIGILIGIAFYLLSRAFAQLAVVYSISPILAALLPAILCFAVVVWLFQRAG